MKTPGRGHSSRLAESWRVAWCGATLLSVFAVSSAFAQPDDRYVPGEVIVRFKAGAGKQARGSVLEALGATEIRSFDRIGAELHRIDTLPVLEAVDTYRDHPLIEYIEPNYIVEAVRTPNDPFFDRLWGLFNTGQTGGTPGADISAPIAWDEFTGDHAIIVGVIDTGIDYNHPDLAANVFINPSEIPGNGLDDDNNGFVDDVRGWDFRNDDNDPIDDHFHGTHVAGTLGAVGDNGVGIAGVNWNVQLMPLKFLNGAGFGSTADAIATIEYSTMMGVHLTNNSWSGRDFSQALYEAIADARNADILFVAAAGNEGFDTDVIPVYPAAYDLDNIISVAAVDHNDQLADFSNFGEITVDVAAPGVGIYSTLPNGSYGNLNGTSMATPHVAGALALIFGRIPGIRGPDAKEALLDWADLLPHLDGVVLTGGRLNASTPNAATDSIRPARVTDLDIVETDGAWIEISWTATGDDSLDGTAARYDLRYSTAPITEATFHDDQRVLGEPRPGAPGTIESLRIRGLAFNTNYHVAVKVLDERRNESALSNAPATTTLPPPIIAVAPPSLSADLPAGESETQVLTISNSGPAEMNFEVAISANAKTANGVSGDHTSARAFVWLRADPSGGVVPSGGTVEVSFTFDASALNGGDYEGDIVVFSNASNPEILVPAQLQVTGIPEIEFSDSSLDFGPIFVGSSSGQSLLVSNPGTEELLVTAVEADLDDYTVDIGPFWLSPGARQPMVVTFSPRTAAPLPGSLIFTTNAPDQGTAVVSLTGTGLDPPVTTVSADSLGDDLFTGELSSLLLEIGNTGGSDLVFRIEAQSLGTRTPPPWLTLSASDGTVSPGSSLEVIVTFDATGLIGGSYRARILMTSNDPAMSQVIVPLEVVVTAASDIEVSRASLDFGDTFLTGSDTERLVISNRGVETLVISEVVTDHPDFRARRSSLEVIPGADDVLLVTFAPVSTGVASGTLTLGSNDPDESPLLIPLTGNGLLPPEIAVSRDSLDPVALFTGATETQTFSLHNSGVSDLLFHVQATAIGDGGFVDGFEDGDLAGWIDAGSGIKAVTDATSANGTLSSYREFDAPSGVYDGVYQDVGPMQPRYVSFWVRSSSTSTYDGYFFLRDSQSNLVIAFLMDGTGALYCNAAAGGDGSVRYQANTWYQIEYRRIDWETKTFDYHVNGTLVKSRIPFLETGVNEVTRVDLFCLSAHAIAWWDEIVISPDRPADDWLYAEPASGAVPAGATTQINAIFDATGLEGRSYRAHLAVSSNDPVAQRIPLPARLEVTAAPNIELSATTIDFGEVFVGAVARETLTVSNTGVALLEVTEVTVTPGDYTVDTSGFVVEPGKNHEITATYEPTVPEATTAIVTLATNDPDETSPTVTLKAGGLGPPVIVIAEDPLVKDLVSGETATHNVTIANTGVADLVFETELVATAPTGSRVDWLAVEPSEGTVPPGESMDLEIVFDAAGLDTSDLGAELRVHSNDPVTPRRVVPARMRVTGIPDIAVSGTGFDFGEIFVGASPTNDLVVSNTGPADLIAELSTTGTAFTVHPVHIVVPRDTEASVAVTFMPLSAGDHAEVLTIASNDPDQPRITLALRGVGLDAPILQVEPTTLTSTLDPGETETQVVTIANPGRHDLEFVIEPVHADGGSGGGGGPDRFGYRWVDSNHAGGPLFDWVEIREIGSLVPIQGDDLMSLSLPIGFSFPYYGVEFSSIRVCTNGFASFSTPFAPGLNQRLPGLTNLPDLLAPFWDDLFLTNGSILTHNDGLRFIIEWVDLVRDGPGEPDQTYTFQIILYPDGRIVYQYLSMGTPTNSATVGIQDHGHDGLLVAYNTDYIHDGLAIQFTSGPPSWLGVSPASGTVLPGSSVPIEVTLDASNIHGFFTGALRIDSNDPQRSASQVPVTLKVGSFPHLVLDQPILNFGEVFVGTGSTLPLVVTSAGTASLSVSNITASGDDVSVNATSFDLPPDATKVVEVTVTPSSTGSSRTDLTIEHNGAGSFTEVSVRRHAVLPPLASIEPAAMTGVALPDGQKVKTLEVCNDGGAELILEAAAINTLGEPSAWLSIAPQTVVVQPNICADFAVTMNASGLEPGEHHAEVRFRTNEPASPTLSMPVLFRVGSVDAADVALVQPTLDPRLGQPIVAHIELPNRLASMRPLVATVRCMGAIIADLGSFVFDEDFNRNGVSDFRCAFDLDRVFPLLPEQDEIEIVITGEIEDTAVFIAREPAILVRPHLLSPNGGEVVGTGSELTVTWELPAGWNGMLTDIHFSEDHGNAWSPVATGLEDRSYVWTVPDIETETALLRVDVYGDRRRIGGDGSDGMFTISGNLPVVHALLPNAPNPFNPRTSIRFELPVASHVTLQIYDVGGRLVRTLLDGVTQPGRHAVTWNGTYQNGVNASSGVFFYRIQAESFTATRRMVLLK